MHPPSSDGLRDEEGDMRLGKESGCLVERTYDVQIVVERGDFLKAIP